MQILGPLLAGNARSFILAAISPDPKDYLETISTLRLATRAQKIQVSTTQGFPQPLKQETRKDARPLQFLRSDQCQQITSCHVTR